MNHSPLETTLVLLKPDCVTGGHTGEVIARFEAAGLQIRGCKMFTASSDLLREHYAHIADKPFYPEVDVFMRSSPVIALALAGAGSVAKVRELAGPTDSQKAPKGTIRGDLGKDVMVNIIHASDSPENGQIELERFFQPSELFDFEMSARS